MRSPTDVPQRPRRLGRLSRRFWIGLVVVVLLVGFGGWFFYDGFYNWPAENRQIEQWRIELDAAKRAKQIAAVTQARAGLRARARDSLRLRSR